MKEGTRVMIKDKEHPWNGYVGEIVGIDFLPVIRKEKVRVLLDNGTESYAAKEQLVKV